MQPETEGQYRVGTEFNPSGSTSVDIIKTEIAKLIDLLLPIAEARGPGGREAAIAMTELEGAAMWAVKAVTKQAR
jgi:hypothetical protein